MEKEIKNLDFYQSPKMMGDHWAIKRVDYYYTQRKKILGYKGASKVDRKTLAFYEGILIYPTKGFWWYNTDKKHLDTILWFLRRLKVGITREQEFHLFMAFCDRLSYFRRVVMGVNKDRLEKLENRWL